MSGSGNIGLIDERVLVAIHEHAAGSSHTPVDLGEIQSYTGLSDKFMRQAVTSLASQGYIRHLAIRIGGPIGPVAITDKGMDKARAAGRSAREVGRVPHPRSAERASIPAAPAIVINVLGNMTGSTIQAGSPGATQRVAAGDIAIGGDRDGQIRAFLAAYDAKLAELRQEQTAEALVEIAPRVGRVRKEIEAPDGDRHLVKDTLASIKAILENGVGGVVTSGLLLLLGQIHW